MGLKNALDRVSGWMQQVLLLSGWLPICSVCPTAKLNQQKQIIEKVRCVAEIGSWRTIL